MSLTTPVSVQKLQCQGRAAGKFEWTAGRWALVRVEGIEQNPDTKR